MKKKIPHSFERDDNGIKQENSIESDEAKLLII